MNFDFFLPSDAKDFDVLEPNPLPELPYYVGNICT